MHCQTCVIGKFLQFPFPQTHAHAIASSAVSGDEQRICARVDPPSHVPPPPAYGIDCECRSVVINTNAHPTLVRADIVHAIRDGLTLFAVKKIMNAYLFRIAFRAPFPPAVLEIAYPFLLLGVHRNRRRMTLQLPPHPSVDVLELRVPVWMIGPLTRLAVGLETVAGLVQQLPHERMARLVALCPKLFTQSPQTLASPSQRRLGISTGDRFNEFLQRNRQARIKCLRCLTPAAGTTNAVRWQLVTRIELA